MSHYLSAEFADLDAAAARLGPGYRAARPFPSIWVDGVFDPARLDEILAEFPDLSVRPEVHYDNPNEGGKFATRGEARFGPKTRDFLHFLNSEPFLRFVQRLTDIEEPLLPDPYFVGGGLHEIKPGGVLKLHADFNKHPEIGLDRRVNVLVYLNKDWKEEYGGHFELWDEALTRAETRILPVFNRMAIFSTTSRSYHGHPDPLTCPPDRSRKSMALYYYSNGRPAREIEPDKGVHSTLFRGRDAEEQKRVEAANFKLSRVVEKWIEDLTPPLLYRSADRLVKRAQRRRG